MREQNLQADQEAQTYYALQADLKRAEERLAAGMENVAFAIQAANDGTHNDEVVAADMAEEPREFEVLKAAATDGRPTYGCQARFWALNNATTSKPLMMPRTIRDSLTKAFDWVATWAAEIRESRLEAQRVLREATEAAERIVASAEGDAAQVIQEARQRGEKLASKDATLQSWSTFVGLMKEKVKLTFGEDGYEQLAKAVNETWETHPDNPNRPPPKTAPVQSTYSRLPGR